MNILEYAMKMELDGKKYYMDLVDQADNAGVKSLFNIIAQEEQCHYDILKSLTAKESLQSESNLLETSKNIFEQMFEEDKKVKTMVSKDALIHALKLEVESVKFYKDHMEKAEDPLEKQVFEQLFNEEKKHYYLLEQLIDYYSNGWINEIND